MANMPIIDTTQTFGRKPVNYYAASGEVIDPDKRARSSERRLRDIDGTEHDVRLSSQGFRFEPGDQAAVLRLQCGPSRKSMPVAVINYADKEWSRLKPDANRVLAQAGVARNLNWTVSIIVLFLAMFLVVWPVLRTFLVEVFPGLFRGMPEFDLFGMAVAAFPDMASLNLAEASPNLIGRVIPGLYYIESYLWFGLLVAAGGAIAYAARSWRLLWLPLLMGAIGLGSIALNGPANAVIPTIVSLFAIAVLFAIGGAVNRARDAWRLENRIAMLATYLLENPPTESIRSTTSPAVNDPTLSEGETAQARTDEEVSTDRVDPADNNIADAEIVTEDTEEARPVAEHRSDDDDTEVGTTSEAAEDSEAVAGVEEAPAELSEASDGENVPEAQDEKALDVESDPVEVDEPEPSKLADDAGHDPVLDEHDPMLDHGPVNRDADVPAEDPRTQSRDISLPPPPPMPN